MLSLFISVKYAVGLHLSSLSVTLISRVFDLDHDLDLRWPVQLVKILLSIDRGLSLVFLSVHQLAA